MVHFWYDENSQPHRSEPKPESGEHNVYAEASEMTRPLALRRHVDVTLHRASVALAAEGSDAALRVLLRAMPKFNRLGGEKLLTELEEAEAKKDPNRPLPRRDR